MPMRVAIGPGSIVKEFIVKPKKQHTMAQDKYLGFLIPEELLLQVEDLIQKMKATDDKKQYATDLYQVVVELSNAGLDYFFIVPLQKAKIGMLKMKSIKVALNTGKKGIFAVAKGILKNMSNEQLSIVLELFEQSLTLRPESEL